MLQSIVFIKSVHTIIFIILSSACFIFLYSAISGRITLAAKISFSLIILEGVVLLINGFKCPLTDVAERLGANSGTVSDIFLPKWLADNIFPIFGGMFFISCLIFAARTLLKQMRKKVQ